MAVAGERGPMEHTAVGNIMPPPSTPPRSVVKPYCYSSIKEDAHQSLPQATHQVCLKETTRSPFPPPLQ